MAAAACCVQAHALGGRVEGSATREFGHAAVTAAAGTDCALLAGIAAEFNVWMSHGDKARARPIAAGGLAQLTHSPPLRR